MYSVEAIATEDRCITELKKYESQYQLSAKVTDKQRLAYLSSSEKICDGNAIHSIFKSKLLLDMGKIDDAFLILDDSIANYYQPIGDLLYEKADLMQRMIFAGYKNNSEHDLSYAESIVLYKQALQTNRNIKPLIYIGLAQVHIYIEELDKAIDYLKAGIKLDNNIARMYSLLGIIESQKNNLTKAQQYLEMSAKIQGLGYLKEPDTVLALAKVFCNAKRKDLVIDLVNKAIKAIPNSEDIPDINQAYDIAKNCPHPNPLG